MKYEEIKLWHVYYIKNFPHTRPQPKTKYVLTVATEENQFLLFLINTKLHALSPDLVVCEPIIKVGEHHFLDYDSHVLCSEIFKLAPEGFNKDSFQGAASTDCVKSVLYAVKACRLLKLKYKKIVIASANEFLDKLS